MQNGFWICHSYIHKNEFRERNFFSLILIWNLFELKKKITCLYRLQINYKINILNFTRLRISSILNSFPFISRILCFVHMVNISKCSVIVDVILTRHDPLLTVLLSNALFQDAISPKIDISSLNKCFARRYKHSADTFAQ